MEFVMTHTRAHTHTQRERMIQWRNATEWINSFPQNPVHHTPGILRTVFHGLYLNLFFCSMGFCF